MRDVPLACSNATSLPEVVGDAAELFDPTDLHAIRDARRAAADRRRAPRELVARGRERVAPLHLGALRRGRARECERALARRRGETRRRPARPAPDPQLEHRPAPDPAPRRVVVLELPSPPPGAPHSAAIAPNARCAAARSDGLGIVVVDNGTTDVQSRRDSRRAQTLSRGGAVVDERRQPHATARPTTASSGRSTSAPSRIVLLNNDARGAPGTLATFATARRCPGPEAAGEHDRQGRRRRAAAQRLRLPLAARDGAEQQCDRLHSQAGGESGASPSEPAAVRIHG